MRPYDVLATVTSPRQRESCCDFGDYGGYSLLRSADGSTIEDSKAGALLM
jgi:hypothetical protein